MNEGLLSMIFQHATELAIRAMLFLAQQDPGKFSPVHEIAGHLGASEAYLAKILQRLTRTGLIRSFRGPGKGMKLGRAPSTITLASLIGAVEAHKSEDDCVLGLRICSDETPCVLHEEWIPIRSAIHELLEKRTLADLAETVRSHASKPGGRLICQSDFPVAVDVSRGRKQL